MKNKSPKQLRIDKKRPIRLVPGIQMVTIDVSVHKSTRADNLPPFDEYKPKRVHVARRRRAIQEHHAFPRGWSIEEDVKDSSHHGIMPLTRTCKPKGAQMTAFKDDNSTWYGEKVS